MAPVPRSVDSYGPDPWLVGLWVALTGAPAWVAVWMNFRLGWTVSRTEDLLYCLVVPAAVAVFATRFRVTFTEDAFVYRRWGPTITVRYRDIAGIEVANVSPVSGTPIGAFIVTRSGQRLPFWPKLFPRRAVEHFFALAEPAA